MNFERIVLNYNKHLYRIKSRIPYRKRIQIISLLNNSRNWNFKKNKENKEKKNLRDRYRIENK